MKDIEHGRYETARISLQTLMNTYESSEYMAKAKLAVADSWFREGGGERNGAGRSRIQGFSTVLSQHGRVGPGPESRLRYPLQADGQERPRLDSNAAGRRRVPRSCSCSIPNSKFVPQVAQKLRDIQESLAEHEFVVGNFYWRREMNPAAANRLNASSINIRSTARPARRSMKRAMLIRRWVRDSANGRRDVLAVSCANIH